MEIENNEGLEYMKTLEDNSIDLILTDPPYIISKETGMNTHYNKVAENEVAGVEQVKTEAEWETYKLENSIVDDKGKSNYLKYGTIYGKILRSNRLWRVGFGVHLGCIG